MAKAADTVFFCKECGYESAKWMGQCPACKEWNTFVEAPKTKDKATGRINLGLTGLSENKPVTMEEITAAEDERMPSGMEEFDRVLGGGIIRGSLVLVGGDPGIGKSTLLTQVCKNLSDSGYKVLYITGEESLPQIKLRADRLGKFNKNMMLLCETDLGAVESAIKEYHPDVAVIDSIQTMYRQDVSSAPGSPGQVRECTGVLMQLAKGLKISLFIVGHVTKEGTVAGPRTLEHMVDTVLYFEGERSSAYRILRGVKNRFGATNEIAVFEMKNQGLTEVKNPSEVMLEGRPTDASGSVVVCSMEGTRPLLIEIQALVAQTNFQMPRRTTVGIDFNRVNLLMAVLEKRAGIHLGSCDAYVNLTGGIRLSEPAADLGIVLALVSSYRNRPVDEHTIIFGEVGLSGEVRGVNMAGQRVKEAAKLGFTICILPATNASNIEPVGGMRLLGVKNVKEAIDLI